MKVCVAQVNPIVGDFSGNVRKILRSIQQGRELGAHIVLFSEMVLTGYPPQDLLLHDAFVEQTQDSLGELISETKGLMVVVGLVRRNERKGEKSLFNSAAVLIDGKCVGFYDKWLLPTYDVFDERRYFQPGTTLGVWDFQNKKVAISICEDIWQPFEPDYRVNPIQELAQRRPDLLLNLSASPYHYEKPDKRIQVCAQAAKTLHVPVIMCCQVGGNDQLVFDGYSVAVTREGTLSHLGKGFEEDHFLVSLDEADTSFVYREDAIKDLFRALVLGTRDYFHKQGFKKACLGLSGGIDSALAACIAVEALGKENVLGLSMPSKYSSEGSVTDAVSLSQNLNIECRQIPIESLFDGFLALLGPHFQDQASDVTEENLQARIRGMILMAFSNKYGHLLLSTGNKSEMAIGYCTLYGDMAGGLALISDVTKRQVYALSKWINREREIIPVSTIEKEPSAELRPNQKDSDSLPSYDILDAVVTAYVEDYLDVDLIAKQFQIPPTLVEDLVHRIHKAEYKRRQAPPGIRVSRKAFRVGRFYPIVQKWM